MNEPSSLGSPAQLLQLLQQQGAEGEGEGAPPLQELLGGARRVQAGAPPLAADQVEVFPEPGFVIKTANEQGQKVFINVCGSAKLPLPGGWAKGQVPPEVKQHLEAGLGGDAPAAMRVPLSFGNPRFETDHRGAPCLVADCIVNSEMLERAAEYRPLKFFLIQLALGHTAQQVGLELDPQYKLPKMRYKGGTPLPQFIRVRGQGGSSSGDGGGSVGPAAAGGAAGPADAAEAGQAGAGSSSSAAGSSKPLIAEVGSDGEEPPAFALLACKRQARQRQSAPQRQQAPAPAAAPQQQKSRPQPAAEQQPAGPVQLQPQIEYVGKPATEVCIRLQLPAGAAAAAQQDPEAISTAICAEAVRVEAPGCAPLKVRLPFAVSAAGGSAELQAAAGGDGSGKSGSCAQLVLRLPYRPFSSVLEELRQAAGAAEGQPGSGGSVMDLD